MNYIDAHSHIWSNDYAHYPLAAGMKPDAKDPDFSAAKILAVAKRSGVDRVVLIQSAEYGTDNDYMVDMIASHPGTFVGVAVIDLTKTVEATMKTMLVQGVAGFRIIARKPNPNFAAWLDGPVYQEMFATASTTKQSVCCLIDPEAIPAVSKMCRRYPNAPVVIDHMARIGVGGSVKESDVDLLCGLAKHPLVRVKISAFYALGERKPPYTDLLPMIRRLYGAFGSRRLMWASDCPYQVMENPNYDESMAVVRDHADFLSADDKEWILRNTAEETFFSVVPKPM
ncbi:MAG: amidohydrolase family protein [Planctomycetia bacterium]